MSSTSTSVYPEFFKTGMGKLQGDQLSLRNLQTLFAALENYHRDIKAQDTVAAILQVTQLYLSGLNLFESCAFYLVKPEDLDFELAHCAPESELNHLDSLVQHEIQSGKFAWALRKDGPVFFEAKSDTTRARGLFYSLTSASSQVGMFCGLLNKERMTSHEISFSLLSILLNTTSEALASLRHLAELKHQILAANRDLERTLRENEVLARIPAESPSPIIRLSRAGQILYANEAAQPLLDLLQQKVGDLVTGDWAQLLDEAFNPGARHEFDATFAQRVFSFVGVAVPEAGYANFYGKDVTQRKQVETERELLIRELQEALTKVKTLSGLLPICAWCKKVRDDQGYWKQIESFIQTHSEAVFSHSICPDCTKKLTADSVEQS